MNQMDNKNELLPIVDSDGNVTGSMTRGEAHGGAKTLHPVVHLHVFNPKGDIYLQRRPDWKDVQPGKWDTATGGHIGFGEDIETALRREVVEELGINDFQYKSLGHYVFESDVEKELVYVHTTVYEKEIHPNAEELNGGRYWTKEEVKQNIGKGVFTPNFEHEYRKFRLDLI